LVGQRRGWFKRRPDPRPEISNRTGAATTKQARRAMGAGYLGSAHERRASHKPFSSSERQP